jgi:hypothetical protein
MPKRSKLALVIVNPVDAMIPQINALRKKIRPSIVLVVGGPPALLRDPTDWVIHDLPIHRLQNEGITDVVFCGVGVKDMALEANSTFQTSIILSASDCVAEMPDITLYKDTEHFLFHFYVVLPWKS